MKNLGELLGTGLLCLWLASCGAIFCNAETNRQSAGFNGYRVMEISPGPSGFQAKVVGDYRTYILPLTVQQADSIKVGDTINFEAEFNGWGTYQRTLWVRKL